MFGYFGIRHLNEVSFGNGSRFQWVNRGWTGRVLVRLFEVCQSSHPDYQEVGVLQDS